MSQTHIKISKFKARLELIDQPHNITYPRRARSHYNAIMGDVNAQLMLTGDENRVHALKLIAQDAKKRLNKIEREAIKYA